MFDFKKFTYLHYLTDRHTQKFGLYMRIKISQLDSSLLWFSIIKYCTMVWCYFYSYKLGLQGKSTHELANPKSKANSKWMNEFSLQSDFPTSQQTTIASQPSTPPRQKVSKSKLEIYFQNKSNYSMLGGSKRCFRISLDQKKTV